MSSATGRPTPASSPPRRSSGSWGCAPRTCASVKSAVDREIGLIEQVLLPALRSNRPERRLEGLDQLDDIVQAATQLRQLLLARGIRRLTGGETR